MHDNQRMTKLVTTKCIKTNIGIFNSSLENKTKRLCVLIKSYVRIPYNMKYNRQRTNCSLVFKVRFT